MHAVTIGSDTAVSRFYTQVSAGNGDIVAGFAYLQGGLLLTSSSVTLTWNCLFPISGNITLNNGTLNLLRDLYTSDIASITSIGNIIGNNYAFDLASTVTGFSFGCSQSLIVAQNIGVQPNTSTIDWSYNEQFITAGGTAAPTNTVENYFFNGGSPTLASSIAGAAAIDAVRWHPSSLLFGTGSASGILNVYSANAITGVFTTVSSNTTFIGANSYRSIAWHPTGAYIATATSATASPVVLYPVTSGGILGTPLAVPYTLTGVSCDWATTGSYLAAGFVTGVANELVIYILGAGPTLTLNASVKIGFDVRVLSWNPVYTDIVAVGLGNTGAGDNVQVYRYSPGTLTQIASAGGFSSNINGIDWSTDGNCLVVSTGSTVATANKLLTYTYNNATSDLILSQGSAFTNSLDTATPLALSPINNYIGQGAAPTATTGQLRISSSMAPCVQFSNLNLIMNNDLALNNCCLTFVGNCSMAGSGNVLSLASTATLSVAANSTLTFKNVTIKGLATNSIRMLSSSSNLVFDNTNLMLDGVYSFTQGSLAINKQVTISGFNSTFLFSSSLPCVIRSKSQLFLDELVTWSHVPPTNARNLLQCTDSSSQLYLNGASLVTTRTGLSLTKGTLVVDRYATITSDAQVVAESVMLGDGINAANNMVVQMYPAATLDVTKGILVNNNI